MTALFIGCIFFQGVAIGLDEFYFHWKRDLPKWERLGHPLDSVAFLIPLGLLAFTSKTPLTIILYMIFGTLSCLCITKDEWIHRKYSGADENWIHSLLFILHSAVLLSGYFVWETIPIVTRTFFFVVLIFAFYQTIFWNFYADRLLRKRPSRVI